MEVFEIYNLKPNTTGHYCLYMSVGILYVAINSKTYNNIILWI